MISEAVAYDINSKTLTIVSTKPLMCSYVKFWNFIDDGHYSPVLVSVSFVFF